jgi:hypothetical protein
MSSEEIDDYLASLELNPTPGGRARWAVWRGTVART